MEYKKEEIKDYFDSYINENKTFLKENYPTTWLDDLHHNGRNFPPNFLHESWMDYLYWDVELLP